MTIGSNWNAGSSHGSAGGQRHTNEDRTSGWVQTCGGCGAEIPRGDDIAWDNEKGALCALCNGG